MENNNKYYVYSHKVVTDNGPMWYVGMTRQNIDKRWQPSKYKNTSFEPYIRQYGWDSIEHRVVANGLEYDTAKRLEDCLILMYRSADSCINQCRSGNIQSKDPKGYNKRLYEDNREERLAKMNQYREEHREELRVSSLLYYKEHSEERALYGKRYRECHREELNAKSKRYYELHSAERNAYCSKYREDHREELKLKRKSKNSKPEWKIYNRVSSFNKRHPDLAVETPMEAKAKYLETGCIPDYIKRDDL